MKRNFLTLILYLFAYRHRDLAMNKYFMNLNDEILAAMVHARCDNINYYDYNY